ncbi:FadR family transcriptional regulator [Paenibacillus sp. N1-5-1-14]|uniref:FadR/GntR family transcriptional regulator n=1 Tax=Paenibacillus radicibacter TaxID=2972488 RepID=UPI002158B0FD|nr:FadR/GntR family transcriptional regulator [Paenibacillus radicibacter]MCR8643454.1 FadR family transcriptional regulator [Paenibacillus radicibacter]
MSYTGMEVLPLANTRLQTKKIYEIVAEQIQSRIQSGEYKAGDRLESVEQLSKNYQVGRSTIREALSALRAIGLVDIRQGEGTFVTKFDPGVLAEPIGDFVRFNKKEMLDFFEVRKMIEARSAAIAAQRRKPEHLEAMRQALYAMENAKSDGNLGEMADADFHIAIAEATQNKMLLRMMNQISETLRDTMRESRRLWLFSKEKTLERLHNEHQFIYNAIEDQNPLLAEQVMLAHLTKVENVFNQYCEENKIE